MCRCGHPGCELPSKAHWCTVCGAPHWTSLDAEDCCDREIAAED